MSNRTSRLLAAAGLCLSGAYAQAAETDSCRIMLPRFEPKAAKSLPADEARFLGGARLRAPVAAPCPRPRRPVNV